jgi:hypothetical protein
MSDKAAKTRRAAVRFCRSVPRIIDLHGRARPSGNAHAPGVSVAGSILPGLPVAAWAGLPASKQGDVCASLARRRTPAA